MTDRPVVCVTGSGLLHAAITTRLARNDLAGQAVPSRRGRRPLVVAVSDTWQVQRHSGPAGGTAVPAVSWLPVRTELGRVLIGPAELPGEPGCLRCHDGRRKRLPAEGRQFDPTFEAHAGALATAPSAWLTGLATSVVAALVADEAHRLLAFPAGSAQPRSLRACLCIGLLDLAVTRSPFLPDPACPRCADPAPDSPDSAVITLTSRPKPSAQAHRVRPAAGDLDGLLSAFVTGDAGMLRVTSDQYGAGYANAEIAIGMADARYIQSFGHKNGHRKAMATGILEGLERYAGLKPRMKYSTVHASYSKLRDTALDPRELGLYPEAWYDQPGFHFRRFSEDADCSWVWGYSFSRGAPVLVPESFAYYGRGSRADGGAFAYECSNGCALGSCIEEAILYGLLEVAERDAFLMTWHAQMPVPKIELNQLSDRRPALMTAALERRTGYRIDFFETTLEQGIPAVWALATARTPGPPRALCGASAHLRLGNAILKALSELSLIIPDAVTRYRAEGWRTPLMAADHSYVRGMTDHPLLYSDPELHHHFDFLGNEAGGRAPRERTGAPAPPRAHSDLRDDVTDLVGRYLGTGMDVIVVDQTAPEHLAAGLRCAKVLIPGTLPMTFGHGNRRLHGLPRLLSVPQQLGYHPAPRCLDDINHWPHPFP
jgi:ribosomal protein S12 methylthiotransferase accessory factor